MACVRSRTSRMMMSFQSRVLDGCSPLHGAGGGWVRRPFRHYVADCGSPAALGASPFSACHQRLSFRALGTIRHHSAPRKPVSARVVSTHPAFSTVFAFVFFSLGRYNRTLSFLFFSRRRGKLARSRRPRPIPKRGVFFLRCGLTSKHGAFSIVEILLRTIASKSVQGFRQRPYGGGTFLARQIRPGELGGPGDLCFRFRV